MRIEYELRNVPQFRIIEYLVEVGGQPTGERSVSGRGWTAQLVELEPVSLHTFGSIPRDLLVIEGDDIEETERVANFMRRKTLRGGG